ncbi:transient receptor potential cation channel subfamily M member 2-like [Chanos chanos]|uniref:Transient receptor potential cation channel subfamily M member 2-like n=1 Tax=Chanos chanos TaxID=29144 RepID=A0A6J2WE62_CHACN|nr:transient receptor potential cation channel subfamily M member 2-like [Chanos chanos]
MEIAKVNTTTSALPGWGTSGQHRADSGNDGYFKPVSKIYDGSTLTKWVKANIKKKECCFYVKDVSKGEEICKCGYKKSDHTDEAQRRSEASMDIHIREVPTDAFGEIDFGGLGQKTSKYVRVSSDTEPKTLYELLIRHWKLQPPNLLISVTGGAKNFQMKDHLKRTFRKGLIKVAQTTGAWIITGGTNTGVMKHVGMAVHEHTLRNGSSGRQIVTIGVATWGIVHNRDSLIHSEGCFHVSYSLDETNQGRLSLLDINHSHFLLVDDGTHGQYEGEIELRSRLEKLISEKPLGDKDSVVKVPVVCVVLNGGHGTLDTIYNAMLNKTPCVVLGGSGRVADVIAEVASLPVSQVTMALIQQLIKKFFGQESDKIIELNLVEWTKKIQDIIRMPQLLTVFHYDEGKKQDVDVAILQAFLKASRSSESFGEQNLVQQLELAVAWNRVDIARSEIFTEVNQWKTTDLHQAMFSALVGHKPEFVRLLLENNVSFGKFLEKEDRLCDLYAKMPHCFFRHKLEKRLRDDKSGSKKKLSLSHVSDEVRHLLGGFTQRLYPISTTQRSDVRGVMTSEEHIEVPCDSEDSKTMDTVCDPGRDLFLWAIVQNQKELAEIIFDQCKDCIAAALAASKILKKLAQEDESGGDESEEMRELANHYEKHAIGVFSECYKRDEQWAQKLLVRISPSWGKTTCLQLALQANDKSFVAHSGVQALLNQIWCGELAVDNPLWKVVLCMFFFPLVYTGFLNYRRDEEIEKEAKRKEEEEEKNARRFVSETCSNPHGNSSIRDSSDRSSLEPLTCSSRLVGLFTSPQVKFYWSIASYFGFLWLFAFVLMIDFQDTPSWRELLLYVWLVSLVFEEIRQIFHMPDQSGFRRKARMYISDIWNILDVLSILLFIIGLALRLQPSHSLFYAGKVILCIDFIIFALRLMAIFTVSRTLGPNIIIVRRMMKDLFFFLFLLSIWIVAYGVAVQGIRVHNEVRLDWIFRGAVYEPYLIIFGELPKSSDSAEFDISTCSVDGTDPLKPKCPVLNENNMPAFPEWMTIILLSVYLLFANILLLNLLIAIFNYTFEEVQDNTDKFWKFQRYELIREYHSRPAAPPPFILFNHLYLFIRKLLLCRPLQNDDHFSIELNEEEEELLLSWEALVTDYYLTSMHQDSSQSMERRIQEMAEKVDTMSELMEREWGQVSTSEIIQKRLTQLEEQFWSFKCLHKPPPSLQWIMDTLRSQGFKSKEDPPTESLQWKELQSRDTKQGKPKPLYPFKELNVTEEQHRHLLREPPHDYDSSSGGEELSNDAPAPASVTKDSSSQAKSISTTRSNNSSKVRLALVVIKHWRTEVEAQNEEEFEEDGQRQTRIVTKKVKRYLPCKTYQPATPEQTDKWFKRSSGLEPEVTSEKEDPKQLGEKGALADI